MPRTTPRCALTRARSSVTSRVFPIPGSPRMSATLRPAPAAAAVHAASSARSSGPRPSSGSRPAGTVLVDTSMGGDGSTRDLFDQLSRQPGRSHAELAAQPLGQRAISLHGGRPVASRGQARDQSSVRLLAERRPLDLTPRQLKHGRRVAAVLGAAGQLLEELDDPLAVTLPRRARPVVLDPLQQVAAAQLERGLGLALRQPFELDRIDPQPVVSRTGRPVLRRR